MHSHPNINAYAYAESNPNVLQLQTLMCQMVRVLQGERCMQTIAADLPVFDAAPYICCGGRRVRAKASAAVILDDML